MSCQALVIENLSKAYPNRKTYRSASWREAAVRKCRDLFGSHSDTLAPFWALRDLCLEVPTGSVLGIVGHNGAGKSTLLKILAKITAPTSGRAMVRGRIGAMLEVGTGFHAELSGRDNILLSGALMGMSRKETLALFDSIVDFAEIDSFVDMPVKFYSSGMYIRLAFAVAAHLEPEILIVDEVLAVGDLRFQRKCLDRMAKVATSGQTVLFVSHNMGAVKQFCSHALWLENGAKMAHGKASDVVDRYIESHANVPQCEWVWPSDQRPTNEHVALVRLGVQSMRTVRNLPIVVEVDYEIFKTDAPISLALTIYDEEDRPILTSPSSLIAHERLGVYRSTCTVDPSLLSCQRYTLGIAACANYPHDLIAVERAITIDVAEGSNSPLPLSPFPLRGVINPQFVWHTNAHPAGILKEMLCAR